MLPDGSTLRQSLESVQKQTNRELDELKVKPVNKGLEQVWFWFLQLNSQRGSNGFGINSLSNQEIWSFFQLEGIRPEPWEVDLIRQFDRVALKELHRQQEKKNKTKK